MAEYLYEAFISYRHSEPDRIIAEKLHKMLEDYRIPKGITTKKGAKRLSRVFRDREELPTSSDLGHDIQIALEKSRYLIVICSPRTPASKWVHEEIEIFSRLHGRDRVLALLIEGEPADSFPEILTVDKIYETNAMGEDIETIRVREPLAADIRPDSIKGLTTPAYDMNSPEGKSLLKRSIKLMKTEKLRLLSPILGCSFDDLKQRQRERFVKRAASIAAGISLFFFSFGSLSFLQASKIWEQSIEINYKNQLIQNKNSQLEEQIKKTQEQKLLAEDNEKKAKENERLARENEQVALENAEEARLQRMEALRQTGIAMENEDRANANAQEALEQRNEAEKQTSIAKSQRDMALENQSLYLAGLSRQQLMKGDRMAAMLLALEGLPGTQKRSDRPFVLEAKTALLNALNYTQPFVETRFDECLYNNADYNLDGSRIIVFNANLLAIHDTISGKSLREFKLSGEVFWSAKLSRNGEILVTESLGDDISVKSVNGWSVFSMPVIRTWDTKTGSLLASYQLKSPFIRLSEISPDGKQVMIAWEDPLAERWKAAVFAVDSLKKVFDIEYTEGAKDFQDIQLTEDWRYLFTRSGNHVVLREGTKGKVLLNADIEGSNFKLSGRRLIYTTDEGVTTFNPTDRKSTLLPLKKEKAKEITAAAVNLQGTEIIVVYSGISFEVLDIAKNSIVMNHIGQKDKYIDVGFSPGGKWIFMFTRDFYQEKDCRLSLWDAKSHGTLISREIENIQDSSYEAKISPDDNRILINSNKNVTVWNTRGSDTASPIFSTESLSPIERFEYSQDGTKLLIVSEKDLNVLDAVSGENIYSYRSEEYIKTAIFSPEDGKLLACREWDGQILSLDIYSKDEKVIVGSQPIGVLDTIAFNRDRTKALSSGRGCKPALWDLKNGRMLGILDETSPISYYSAFNNTGDIVVTAGIDRLARIWSAENGKLLDTLEGHTGVIKEMAFSPDGSRLATLSLDDTLRIWDMKRYEEILTIPAGYYEGLSFSPDGSKISAFDLNKRLFIWDVITGQRVHEWNGYDGNSFSPDSSSIVAKNSNGNIKVLNLSSGKELFSLDSDQSNIKVLAFSPDGKYLSYGTRNGQVFRIPLLNTEELITAAKAQLNGRELTQTDREAFFISSEE